MILYHEFDPLPGAGMKAVGCLACKIAWKWGLTKK